MRISPWIHYQLVEQEANPQIQLAPTKDQISRRCAPLICFGRASAGANGIGPEHHAETSLDFSTIHSGEASVTDNVVDKSERKICLKSSLKKPFTDCSVLAVQDDDKNDSLREVPRSTDGFTKRRKLQWTDACGKDLVKIKEFVPSDDELSDHEFEHDGDKCQCVIQ